MAEPLLEPIYEKITGSEVPDSDESYVQRRDHYAKNQEKLKEENPWTYGGSQLAGGVSTALIPGVAGAKIAQVSGKGAAHTAKLLEAAEAAKTLSRGEKLFKAGAVGFGYGAAMNPGDKEGEISGLQIKDRLFNGGIGATTGVVVQGGAEAIGKGAQKVGEYFKGKASEKAFKAATGARGKDLIKAKASGEDKELGQVLLDEGAIPVFGTTGRIANRVEKLKEEAGEEVGRLVNG